MKFRWLRQPPPLRLGIPLLVLLFSLGYDVVNSWVLFQGEVRREYERGQRLALEAAAALSQAIQSDTDGDERITLHELQRLHTIAGRHLRWALACDADQAIRFALIPEKVGKKLSELERDPKVAELAEWGLKESAPKVIVASADTILAVQPIPATANHHGVKFVIVSHDPSRAVASEKWESIGEGAISASLHLVACIALWILLHYFLTWRVNHLLNAARPEGSLSSRKVQLRGGDEFAELLQAFNENDNLLQQIAMHSRDAIFMLSLDRLPLYVSRAHTRIWGVDKGELGRDGRKWIQTVVEEDRAVFLTFMDPLFEGAETVTQDYRIRRPDGNTRWINTRAFPVYSDEGVMIKIAGITSDITERHELEREILDISDKERVRMGYDLHDDLCQRLAAIRVRSELLRDALIAGATNQTANSVKIHDQLAEAVTLCRELAQGLSPVSLEDDGFMQALEKLLSSLRELYDVSFVFDCPNPVSIYNNTTATHLYRIAQELITNAVKHAAPSKIVVSLHTEDWHLRLEVSHDGASYKQSATSSTQGLGLRTIRYRANLIGASVQYMERGDDLTGTTAVCLVPVSSCGGPLSV